MLRRDGTQVEPWRLSPDKSNNRKQAGSQLQTAVSQNAPPASLLSKMSFFFFKVSFPTPPLEHSRSLGDLVLFFCMFVWLNRKSRLITRSEKLRRGSVSGGPSALGSDFQSSPRFGWRFEAERGEGRGGGWL